VKRQVNGMERNSEKNEEMKSEKDAVPSASAGFVNLMIPIDLRSQESYLKSFCFAIPVFLPFVSRSDEATTWSCGSVKQQPFICNRQFNY
jgi:hypothetical protein